MSFLENFRQASPIDKPFICLSCRQTFRFKAHAANHKKQARSMGCRERGFIHKNNEQQPSREIGNDEGEQAEVKQVGQDAGNPNDAQQSLEAKLPVADNEEGDIIFNYGEDIERAVEQLRKEAMSRKGCMKASSAKISRCIRRMEEISASDETRSKRSIANQVAIEFSTVARSCYR